MFHTYVKMTLIAQISTVKQQLLWFQLLCISGWKYNYKHFKLSLNNTLIVVYFIIRRQQAKILDIYIT